MTGRLVILGSGTSFGVPVVGCTCHVCRSDDPRDRRTRVAAVVEDAESGHRILIDTPPELRLQLIAQDIDTVNAVLYTHDHADHVHGIDDLRALSIRNGRLPIYGPGKSLERMERRFDYIFDANVRPPRGTSKPELTTAPIAPGTPISVAGFDVLPLLFGHGPMDVFGYRFGDVAYLTDVKTIPPESRAALEGVRVLVVNGLFDRPHPTHLSLQEAAEFAGEVGAEQAFLTHLTHRYSHRELMKMLPDGVEPAFDGLTVSF